MLRRGLVHPRDADAWRVTFVDVEGGGRGQLVFVSVSGTGSYFEGRFPWESGRQAAGGQRQRGCQRQCGKSKKKARPAPDGGSTGGEGGGVGSGASSFSTGTPLSPSKAVNHRPRKDNVGRIDFSEDKGSGRNNDNVPGWVGRDPMLADRRSSCAGDGAPPRGETQTLSGFTFAAIAGFVAPTTRAPPARSDVGPGSPIAVASAGSLYFPRDRAASSSRSSSIPRTSSAGGMPVGIWC
eukprot:g5541.t1